MADAIISNWKPDFTKDNPYEGMPDSYKASVEASFVSTIENSQSPVRNGEEISASSISDVQVQRENIKQLQESVQLSQDIQTGKVNISDLGTDFDQSAFEESVKNAQAKLDIYNKAKEAEESYQSVNLPIPQEIQSQIVQAKEISVGQGSPFVTIKNNEQVVTDVVSAVKVGIGEKTLERMGIDKEIITGVKDSIAQEQVQRDLNKIQNQAIDNLAAYKTIDASGREGYNIDLAIREGKIEDVRKAGFEPMAIVDAQSRVSEPVSAPLPVAKDKGFADLSSLLGLAPAGTEFEKLEPYRSYEPKTSLVSTQATESIPMFPDYNLTKALREGAINRTDLVKFGMTPEEAARAEVAAKTGQAAAIPIWHGSWETYPVATPLQRTLLGAGDVLSVGSLFMGGLIKSPKVSYPTGVSIEKLGVGLASKARATTFELPGSMLESQARFPIGYVKEGLAPKSAINMSPIWKSGSNIYTVIGEEGSSFKVPVSSAESFGTPLQTFELSKGGIYLPKYYIGERIPSINPYVESLPLTGGQSVITPTIKPSISGGTATTPRMTASEINELMKTSPVPTYLSYEKTAGGLFYPKQSMSPQVAKEISITSKEATPAEAPLINPVIIPTIRPSITPIPLKMPVITTFPAIVTEKTEPEIVPETRPVEITTPKRTVTPVVTPVTFVTPVTEISTPAKTPVKTIITSPPVLKTPPVFPVLPIFPKRLKSKGGVGYSQSAGTEVFVQHKQKIPKLYVAQPKIDLLGKKAVEEEDIDKLTISGHTIKELTKGEIIKTGASQQTGIRRIIKKKVPSKQLVLSGNDIGVSNWIG